MPYFVTLPLDGGWTDLHQNWESPSSWTRENDWRLLMALVKYPFAWGREVGIVFHLNSLTHGYGKWPEIIRDKELDILAPAVAELQRLGAISVPNEDHLLESPQIELAVNA